MTITNNKNNEFYSNEADLIFLGNTIENILIKSKLFPLSYEQIIKQISQKINTQKNKRIEQAINNLEQNGVIILLDINNKPAYFHKKNEKCVLNKFIEILQQFHKQFPYKTGISKSQIREHFANNKKKKKQKSICSFLLNHIIRVASDKQVIEINGDLLAIKEFEPCGDSCEISLENLMKLIAKNFNYDKCNKKELAKDMSISVSEVNYLLKILKQKKLVFEIKENTLIDIHNLQKLKDLVKNKIQSNGPTNIRDFAQSLNKSRNSIVPFFEFLDKINYTKRIDNKRILVNE